MKVRLEDLDDMGMFDLIEEDNSLILNKKAFNREKKISNKKLEQDKKNKNNYMASRRINKKEQQESFFKKS